MATVPQSVSPPSGPATSPGTGPTSGPHSTYTTRLAELFADAVRLKKKDDAYGRLKLLLLAAAVVVAVVALLYHTFSMWWLAVPLAVFVYLAVVHERVLREVRRIARARAFYERGVARLENRWMGTGQSGERFLDPRHPYARDLDIFGRGSIFELICTARTKAGEETLAAWLLAPAAPDVVRARNDAVSELRGRLDLREDLANLGEDIQTGVQPEALARWGEGFSGVVSAEGTQGGLKAAAPETKTELPKFSSGLRIVTFILSAIGVVGIVLWLAWSVHWLIIAVALVNVALSFRYLKSIEEQVGAIERSAKDLALLAGVLARLEQETFAAPLLVTLRERLKGDGIPASEAIRRLNKLIQLLESRRNQVVAVLEPFVMWSLQLTFAIVAWRRAHGPSIRKWLEAVGELEALSDLAGYAYEHPADVFPEFTAAQPGSNAQSGGCFDATDFAHPLIPEDRAIRNDLKLDQSMRLVVISGPNMAGKSTFIRAVGVNAVLAQCGAPVRAKRLRISRLTVAASVCILDSLQGGISHFYAEITRLKLITDLARGETPVLYLLDELLSGTNSHDRRIGAEAIVRSLFERGALGLVTTHDLALAEIVSTLGSQASNAHFEDHLKDGKLGFDHRLSPGIVKTSNALQLMRSIGLEI
jgi:MutS domain V